MKARSRRLRPLWHVTDVHFQALEMLDGTGSFRMSERDARALEMLLEHTFLARRHLPFRASLNAANKRLHQLYLNGLVAYALADGARGAASERAYGLTRLGFDVLLLTGSRVAEDTQADWRPPYVSLGVRNNMAHQLAVADLASLIVSETRRAGHDVDWRGSRRLVQRVHPMMAGGQRLELSPDAALLFDTGAVLLVEHERSLRPGDFNDRVTKYRRFFDGKAWEAAYAREPLVLFSVDDQANTQGYSSAVYDLAKEQAGRRLLNQAHFLRESAWRRGQLAVDPAVGNQTVHLLELVGVRRVAGKART